jgi:AraC-like DNA-binding protein
MNADIQLLFNSSLFRFYDFKCREENGTISKPEWRDNYSVNFTVKGNFGFKTNGNIYDIHSCVIRLENAETECLVSHNHDVKDECTSLYVKESLLNEMAWVYSESKQVDILYENSTEGFRFPCVLINSTPEFEHIHKLIYQIASGNIRGKSLKIDLLIIDLLQRIFAHLFCLKHIYIPVEINKKLKDLHLETIDCGKKYILNNFQNDINLSDIANNANVSQYHFSRLFKHFTSFSPYQYLLEMRLNHALLLLQNTILSITEICFESGFNSLEHFITSFTKRYSLSPLKFRQRNPL